MSDQKTDHDHADADSSFLLPADERDPNSSSTIYVGIVGILLLVLSFLGLQAMYRSFEHNETYTKVVSKRAQDAIELDRTQREQLTGYRIVDKAKKTVSIPIERAMSIMAGELKSR